jgi:hypothetical protein
MAHKTQRNDSLRFTSLLQRIQMKNQMEKMHRAGYVERSIELPCPLPVLPSPGKYMYLAT